MKAAWRRQWHLGIHAENMAWRAAESGMPALSLVMAGMPVVGVTALLLCIYHQAAEVRPVLAEMLCNAPDRKLRLDSDGGIDEKHEADTAFIGRMTKRCNVMAGWRARLQRLPAKRLIIEIVTV